MENSSHENFDAAWPVDVYFPRAKVVADCLTDKRRVIYRYFAREEGMLFGTPFIKSLMEDSLIGTTGLERKDWPIIRILPEGAYFKPAQVIMEIETIFQLSVAAETSILGILSYCGAALRMNRIVKAARGRPVYAFEARHFPPPMAAMTACAAKLGGASGTSCTTGAALARTYEYGSPSFDRTEWIEGFKESNPRFDLCAVGTNPHASAAIMPMEGEEDSFVIGASRLSFMAPPDLPEVRNAEIFLKAFPGIPSLVLNDYSGRELDASRLAARLFKDEPNFFGVRCDTCGERFHQGASFPNRDLMVSEFKMSREDKWKFGRGVTIELLKNVRKAMDGEENGKRLKIMASSGFNEAKTAFFDKEGAPFDSVGTGSYVHLIGVTSDIVAVKRGDGEWKRRVKAGREWLADKKPEGLIELRWAYSGE